MERSKCRTQIFQGKIQALKKTASKGDKKKKKEVTEEIAKLESELDQRHAQELASLAVDVDVEIHVAHLEAVDVYGRQTGDRLGEQRSRANLGDRLSDGGHGARKDRLCRRSALPGRDQGCQEGALCCQGRFGSRKGE